MAQQHPNTRNETPEDRNIAAEAESATSRAERSQGAEGGGLQPNPQSNRTNDPLDAQSVADAGANVGSWVRNTMSATLKSVGTVGDDALIVTRDILKEAISATEDVGTTLVSGTTHLAKDVVIGVNDVGGEAVNAVAGLLTSVVGGVRQIAGAAVGGRKSQIEAGRGSDDARVQREHLDRPPASQASAPVATPVH